MLELPLVHFPCPLFCTIEKSKESAPKILTMLGNLYLRSTLSRKYLQCRDMRLFLVVIILRSSWSRSSFGVIRVLI